MYYDGISFDDTICAPATPKGVGGIAVIRISGKKSIDVAKSLARFLPSDIESHKSYFGQFVHPKTNKTLDEGLISYFSKSYTGESSCEISCHGNPLIVDSIVGAILDTKFVRLAQPGEFTYRAFLNSKMDLTQAESVLSLIHARSNRAKEQALLQLRGGLREKLLEIKKIILDVLSDIEASIDFSHEDIEIISERKIQNLINSAIFKISQIIETYKSSKLLNSGFMVSIVGRANVGKSSLLNKLLLEDKAIVSDIEGTTRDVIEGRCFINDTEVIFLDTAGFKEHLDELEKIGISKTNTMIETSDLVLFVTDEEKLSEEDLKIVSKIKTPVIVNSKSDLWNKEESKPEGIAVSSKEDFGIDVLKKKIAGQIEKNISDDSVILTHKRQFETLKYTLDHLKKALHFENEIELTALDLRLSLKGVLEVLGEEFDDEVLDQVFSKFCIGK